MKVIVKLSEWYALGNTWNERVPVGKLKYHPRLEGRDGRCCLGFACNAHAPGISMYNFSEPSHVRDGLPHRDWMVSDSHAGNSNLSNNAIDQNDGAITNYINWSEQPIEVRMGNLISIFLEGGDELIFEP